MPWRRDGISRNLDRNSATSMGTFQQLAFTEAYCARQRVKEMGLESQPGYYKSLLRILQFILQGSVKRILNKEEPSQISITGGTLWLQSGGRKKDVGRYKPRQRDQLRSFYVPAGKRRQSKVLEVSDGEMSVSQPTRRAKVQRIPRD